MRRFFYLFTLVLVVSSINAQSTFIPYNPDYYHLIDRFQIKFQDRQNLLPVTNKPVRRADLANFLKQVRKSYDSLSIQDQYNLRYLLNDNWIWSNSEFNDNDKSWYDLMYTRKSDFLHYKSDNFTVRINPVAEFLVGNDSDQDGVVYTNTRGAEVQGTIDNRIGFYSFLTTTQARFEAYATQRVRNRRAFPNEGFWKTDANVFDLTHARGYLTFKLSPSIDLQAGYDKHFIGNGQRSMILSDFSSPMLFAKISTRLGIFNYTNFWAELTEDIIFANALSPGDGDYPKKYMSFHRLGLNLTPNLEIGFFESIISSKANINYFNPVIFYRAVEQQEGSPDNILLGLDFRLNHKRKYQVYGQFILDEFLISSLRSGDGDWRNKFGVQLGLKWIDAGNISNLDLQAEFNTARPYMYAHDEPSLSYTNYRNPLAHPFGANFREWILSARYQPKNKITVSGRLIRTTFGEDTDATSFGGDLLRTTDERAGDLGNNIGQGIAGNNIYLEAIGSYQLLHNLFVDARFLYRNLKSDDLARDQSGFIPSVSLRWTVARRQHVF